MTHKTGWAILLILASQTLQAQQNTFKIGIGYQRTRMLDQQASPLQYNSSAATFKTGYYKTSNQGKFTAELAGALGNMSPAGTSNRYWYSPVYDNNGGIIRQDSFPLSGKLYNGMINIGWMKDISSGTVATGKSETSIRQFAGLSASDQLFYSDNIVRAGWMNNATLNGDYQLDVSSNARHFFSLKITIPLFGVNTRLPYHNTVASPKGESHAKTIFKEGSQVAWLGNFQNIRVEASYEYAIGKNFGLGLRYSGQWLQYPSAMPINLYQNNLGIEATFK
jgi:hypothetical protein